MRRAGSIVILLALATAACNGGGGPEGRVERWLLALNQGSAGHASRYAGWHTSNQILPNARMGEPGRLDVVEVGKAIRTQCSDRVPIRVIRTDGHQIEGYAVVQQCPTIPIWDIIGIERANVPPGTFPSEGGHAFGAASAPSWLVAIGIALVIALLSEGAMRFARRRATD